jgi:hypothetical protein
MLPSDNNSVAGMIKPKKNMLNCDGMLGDDFNHATLSFQEPNCTSSI